MIRVALADDHAVLREGLRQVLGAHPDLVVVGEAGTGFEALVLATSTGADVLIVDVAMPGPPFLELLRRLRETAPAVRLVVYTASADDEFALRALRGGALGFVGKERPPQELVAAIRTVSRGQRYLPPSLAERLALEAIDIATRPPHRNLSERELELVGQPAAGRSLKEIAARMGVSAKTASTYRARALEKLGLATTAELIRYALENGLAPHPRSG